MKLLILLKMNERFYNNEPFSRHAELVSASPKPINCIVTVFKRCRNKFGMTCEAVVFFTRLFLFSSGRNL
jgi:hypothetical protein